MNVAVEDKPTLAGESPTAPSGPTADPHPRPAVAKNRDGLAVPFPFAPNLGRHRCPGCAADDVRREMISADRCRLWCMSCDWSQMIQRHADGRAYPYDLNAAGRGELQSKHAWRKSRSFTDKTPAPTVALPGSLPQRPIAVAPRHKCLVTSCTNLPTQQGLCDRHRAHWLMYDRDTPIEAWAASPRATAHDAGGAPAVNPGPEKLHKKKQVPADLPLVPAKRAPQAVAVNPPLTKSVVPDAPSPAQEKPPMPRTQCSVALCTAPSNGHGLCACHRQRWVRAGRPKDIAAWCKTPAATAPVSTRAGAPGTPFPKKGRKDAPGMNDLIIRGPARSPSETSEPVVARVRLIHLPEATNNLLLVRMGRYLQLHTPDGSQLYSIDLEELAT